MTQPYRIVSSTSALRKWQLPEGFVLRWRALVTPGGVVVVVCLFACSCMYTAVRAVSKCTSFNYGRVSCTVPLFTHSIRASYTALLLLAFHTQRRRTALPTQSSTGKVLWVSKPSNPSSFHTCMQLTFFFFCKRSPLR